MRTSFCFFLLLACAPGDGRSTPTRLTDDSGRKTSEGRRTDANRSRAHVDTFDVRGPTLISAFVTTRAEADSSDDVNEALGDYQEYLGRTIPLLKREGVTVYLTSDTTIFWRDRSGVHSLVAVDSGGIVYMFIMPTGDRTVLREGVITDVDILDSARHRFGLALLAQDTVRLQ